MYLRQILWNGIESLNHWFKSCLSHCFELHNILEEVRVMLMFRFDLNYKYTLFFKNDLVHFFNYI